MSLELDYLRRISKCEVPGLTVEVRVFENGYTVTVSYGGNMMPLGPESSWFDWLCAAMFVVFALEADGWEYYREGDDRTLWLRHPELDRAFHTELHANQNDGKEHLALLSLLADVVEAAT